MGIIIPTLQRNKLRLKMLSNSYCWWYNRLINREMGVGATVAISFGKPGILHFQSVCVPCFEAGLL